METYQNLSIGIDWSTICHKNFHKMASSGYEAEHGNEDLEFGMNMYLYILYIKTRFNPDKLYFAIDSKPYWRDTVYQDWYVENTTLYQYNPVVDSIGEGESKQDIREPQQEYLTQFDQKNIKYTYSDEKQGYFMKKLTKALFDDIVWEDWIEIGEPTDDEIHERCSDVIGVDNAKEEHDQLLEEHADKKREILYTELKEHMPKYKGKRDEGTWDFDTPKRGYTDGEGNYVKGFYDLSESLAYSLAGTFDALPIKAEGAEADDIVAQMVKNGAPSSDIIIISVDSDLHQLACDNMFFHYFNPVRTPENQYVQWGYMWDEITPKSALYDLRLKLLMGDEGDKIAPCMQLDPKTGKIKTTCIGKKTAEKWLAEKSLKEIVALVEPKSFARNRKLIHLDNMPQYIKDRIQNAMVTAVIPDFVPPEEYNVPTRKRLQCEQSAYADAGMQWEADAMDEDIKNASTELPEMAEDPGGFKSERAAELRKEADVLNGNYL